jgi:hypothetical protein
MAAFYMGPRGARRLVRRSLETRDRDLAVARLDEIIANERLVTAWVRRRCPDCNGRGRSAENEPCGLCQAVGAVEVRPARAVLPTTTARTTARVGRPSKSASGPPLPLIPRPELPPRGAR